ncbi:hypothetical protein EDC56_2226 [Sinobacterium caligoides]|uniref:Uncharacterized protein n=1 Tax=Sinobacterium caligoides TaxID=933926 RepID=A0A3N2DPP6_9GAMM|nr:hypothetical protein [Sinobacterium caligoides]ROS01781.1 hypothetical protein EDC56_2226 [Sinobacterium caligoides]
MADNDFLMRLLSIVPEAWDDILHDARGLEAKLSVVDVLVGEKALVLKDFLNNYFPDEELMRSVVAIIDRFKSLALYRDYSRVEIDVAALESIDFSTEDAAYIDALFDALREVIEAVGLKDVGQLQENIKQALDFSGLNFDDAEAIKSSKALKIAQLSHCVDELLVELLAARFGGATRDAYQRAVKSLQEVSDVAIDVAMAEGQEDEDEDEKNSTLDKIERSVSQLEGTDNERLQSLASEAKKATECYRSIERTVKADSEKYSFKEESVSPESLKDLVSSWVLMLANTASNMLTGAAAELVAQLPAAVDAILLKLPDDVIEGLLLLVDFRDVDSVESLFDQLYHSRDEVNSYLMAMSCPEIFRHYTVETLGKLDTEGVDLSSYVLLLKFFLQRFSTEIERFLPDSVNCYLGEEGAIGFVEKIEAVLSYLKQLPVNYKMLDEFDIEAMFRAADIRDDGELVVMKGPNDAQKASTQQTNNNHNEAVNNNANNKEDANNKENKNNKEDTDGAKKDALSDIHGDNRGLNERGTDGDTGHDTVDTALSDFNAQAEDMQQQIAGAIESSNTTKQWLNFAITMLDQAGYFDNIIEDEEVAEIVVDLLKGDPWRYWKDKYGDEFQASYTQFGQQLQQDNPFANLPAKLSIATLINYLESFVGKALISLVTLLQRSIDLASDVLKNLIKLLRHCRFPDVVITSWPCNVLFSDNNVNLLCLLFALPSKVVDQLLMLLLDVLAAQPAPPS